jgi:hypothetical protein
MGPLMTVLGATPTQGSTPPTHPESVVYPLPVEQNGFWSWWEKDAASNGWTGYGLVKASSDARSTSTPNSLREGNLQFITDLDK